MLRFGGGCKALCTIFQTSFGFFENCTAIEFGFSISGGFFDIRLFLSKGVPN